MDGFKCYFEECCCSRVTGDKQASAKAGNRWLGNEQESGSVITPMH